MLRHFTDLDLRLPRIFASVVRRGGFTAAQAELNMRQSNISIHILPADQELPFRPERSSATAHHMEAPAPSSTTSERARPRRLASPQASTPLTALR